MSFIIHMTSNSVINDVIIFYDDEFEKAVDIISDGMKYHTFSANDLKCHHFFSAFNPEKKRQSSLNNFVDDIQVSERIIIYYYVIYKMSFSQIGKKLNVSEGRVSYLLNKYIKRKGFKNKNEYILHSFQRKYQRKI
ncbi:sigma factor-like helix-turn-helix DNA-binding protein [Enterobacter cloacae]|uniref:sigma factor-like helix-turn-helix DNA-binding protein n=1 Tax=Enterobacter cloacae TaxID=550 RepID=UPI002A45CEA8|nr:hypothetical protein [Enterobacter cloacae]